VELPTRPVIISFDDGWEGQYINAVPILRRYHYPATFFIVTNYLGDHGFLSFDQLRAMTTIGMTIGSHSRSHPHLEQITSPTVLWDEIYRSKKSSKLHFQSLLASLLILTDPITLPPLRWLSWRDTKPPAHAILGSFILQMTFICSVP
jgi:hypothetical protein